MGSLCVHTDIADHPIIAIADDNSTLQAKAQQQNYRVLVGHSIVAGNPSKSQPSYILVVKHLGADVKLGKRSLHNVISHQSDISLCALPPIIVWFKIKLQPTVYAVFGIHKVMSIFSANLVAGLLT